LRAESIKWIEELKESLDQKEKAL